MWSDLVLSLRRMRRHPGMWLVVVLNLTIGLSGVIAAFSVVRAVLLRQLPYPDSHQLVLVWEDNSKRGVGLTPNSALNIKDVKATTTSFQKMGFLSEDTVTLYAKADAEPIKAYRVSPDVFAVTNVQPQLGRVLTQSDEEPGTPKVTVLSYGFWQRRFGGDPSIVGREITLSGDSHTVVGVMPKGFGLPPTFRATLIGTNITFHDSELWLPIKTNELPPLRRVRSYMTLARLTPNATPEQAQNELHVVGGRLATDYPDVDMGLDYRVVPLSQQVLGNVRPVLIVLFVVAVLVLLLSIANAVHILLVDLSYRLSELALRSALGATPLAMIRQLAIANLAACAVATAAALVCAQIIVTLVTQASDAGVARLSESAIDGPVVLFTAGLAIVVACATTMLTVRHVVGQQIAGVVREALSGGGALRRILLVTHVAIVIVVLAVAAALTRSWWQLSAVTPGIRADGVTVLQFMLPQSRYDTPPRRIEFQRRLLAEVQGASAGAGVQAAAMTDYFPFGDDTLLSNITVDKRVPKDAYDEPKAFARAVSPSYFQVLAIPLISGRLFDDHDDVQQPVAVVSEAFVRRYGDGHDIIGRRIKVSVVDPALWVTIVGIVGWTHGAGLSLPPQPEVLYPYGLRGKRANINLLVYSTQPRGAVLGALGDAIRRVDDQLKPTVTAMEDHVSKAMGRSRLYGRVFGILAALAMILGVSGIYGAQSLLVSRKSRDIGVRLCLGAEPDQVIRALLVRFVYTGLAGVVLGIALAALGERQLAEVLYGINAPDWLTIGGSALLVIAMGAAATYLPARRACRQPLRALLDDVTVRASG
jgi:putative ABC transport system permease protein